MFLILLLSSFQPIENYKVAFGKNYRDAIIWIKKNNILITSYCLKYQVPRRELISIVFPELMRYNSFEDAIEATTLSFLYIDVGKEYADFSIGHFQMKPSFAETIEKDIALLPAKDKKRFSNTFLSETTQIDTKKNRSQRILFLNTTEGQILYLIAFYKICSQKFKSINFSNRVDQLRFIATCYNTGYSKTKQEIESIQTKNYFNLNKISFAKKYNYAEIVASVFLYESL